MQVDRIKSTDLLTVILLTKIIKIAKKKMIMIFKVMEVNLLKTKIMTITVTSITRLNQSIKTI